MPNNSETYFAATPVLLDMPRSTFDMPFDHKMTFNVGEVVPIGVFPHLPGDTFQMTLSGVVRLQTLIKPPFDDLYLDIMAFDVSERLNWSHWKEFCGENTSSAWIPAVEYTKPQTTAPSGGWTKGTIADHMGIPIGVDNFSVDSSYFRGYTLIINDWFRSEVLQDPAVINVGDSTTAGSNGSHYVTDLEKGGKPFIAGRLFDLFSSCTPTPQKGPDVMLPIGTDNAWPVVAGAERIPIGSVPTGSNGAPFPVMMDRPQLNNPNNKYWSSAQSSAGYINEVQSSISNNYPIRMSATPSSTNPYPIPDVASVTYDQFSNLYAISPGGIAGATINELRLAFQIQKFFERQSIAGSRYTEVIRSMFSVVSPDARLQRPEYLGGFRRRLNISQVIQQSSTDSTSPQGNLAAISHTTMSDNVFRKSFTEHGTVFVLGVVRYKNSYQQGLSRHFSRKTKFDYYWPLMANIGNQPVKVKEIYLTGTSSDEEVFGYNEAWFDYRYTPNLISGELRSTYAQSLDSWHFADYYTSQPYLSDTWLQTDKGNVDRALAVTSAVSDQLLGDFSMLIRATRPMPVHSVPGLIDHH